MAKAHKNAVFVLGDGCRELSTARHEPCGVHLAAVRQATDCRNLPRNLPPCMLPQPAAKTYLPLIPPWRYRRGTTAKSYRRVHTAVCFRRELSPGIPPCIPPCLLPQPTCRAYYRAYPRTTYLPLILPCIPRTTYPPGILPRDGSRAQRAGDSDVGANDKGACDDPGDGVDAH